MILENLIINILSFSSLLSFSSSDGLLFSEAAVMVFDVIVLAAIAACVNNYVTRADAVCDHTDHVLRY